MAESVVLRSFAGGELAPALAVRADLAKYQQGVRTCRNFIIQRHGGAANRPGTRFIGACKTNAANVKLLRYTAESEGDSVLIEAGEGYFRFYQNGALVTLDITSVDDWSGVTAYVVGDLVKRAGVIYYCDAAHTNHQPPNVGYWYALTGSIYEVPSPFTSTGLFNWSQSGRVITLTHRDVAPYELIFEAIDRWVIRPVTTAPLVSPPSNVALANTAGTLHYGYVVTAAAPGSYEESIASAQVVDASAAAPTQAAPHVITWTAQTLDGVACPEYYIYCDPYGNGTYGFIGTATAAAQFNNPGITPDFTLTPPLAATPFAAAGAYPHVSATYQQRRFFAQTVDVPDSVAGSRVGLASNFGVASPLQDDDAISFRIAGNNHHPVRHMVGLKAGLVVLTGAGEWTVRGPQGAALGPNAIEAEQETYVGAAEDVPPVVIGNGILYVQGRASLVRELKFDVNVEGLAGKDMTVFAGHLFDGFTFRALDAQITPHSIVWAVRSDGTLLGLTYIPEQDVWGWHRHDTQGIFYDVCVVPEAGADALYVIAARTVGGATQMYIERMASRTILNWTADVFFVDAGLSYDGAAVTSIAGLDHLEGLIVAVVGDGTVVFDGDPKSARAAAFTVKSGRVTLPAAYQRIHVGLPIRFADLETMDLDVAGSAIRDKPKRIAAVSLALEKSARTFLVGPDSTKLTRFAKAPYDPADLAFTGDVELHVQSHFNKSGRVFIRQTDPLPLTVLGLVPSVELGG